MNSQSGLLALTPLGSCRVTNPLRLCSENDGCALNMARVYGYTHSSAEAVQMARFLQTDFEPSAECLPVLMPSQSYTILSGTEHVRSDMYFVEVSSQKLVRVGGVCVQLNYLNRHFCEFFADRTAARTFWSLVRQKNREGVRELLAAHPAYQAYGPQDRNILEKVEMTTIGQSDLRRDVGELQDRLGNIVVVTHCDARQADGSPVRGRGAFIATVKEVCAQLGVRCFDPTAQMREFGQDRAMKEDGLSTTHFTSEFERTLYNIWLERWIAPAAAAKMARLGHAANAKGGTAAAQGPRLQDRFSRAAILRALEGNPKDPGLNRAMADLLIQEGEHARALELLSVVEAADGLQPADILQIGQCQLALRQFDAALESAEMYLALEAEAEAGILLAAQSARGTARPSRAIAYWRELFDLGAHRREACLTIAEIETGRGKHAEALTWVERLIAIDSDSAEARRLHAELLALTGAPDARLSSALERLAGLDRRSFFDVFDRVTTQGRYLAAAAALRAMLEQATPDRQVQSMVRGCAREWLMKGRECVAAGDELAAAVLFQASEILDPEDARAARGLKKIEAGWRKHIRAAFRERDFPKVIEAGEPVLALRPQLAETAVLVGRAHYALEQWEAAFKRLTAAIDSGAQGPLPWLFRGRSAMKAGAFEAAFESFEAVQRLAGKGEARMRTEAATNCARLPDRAAREALRLVRAGDLDRAWALAGFGVKHRPGDPLAEKVRAEVVRCLTTKFRSDLRKRPDDAIDTGWLLLERDPENLVALRVLPRLLMRERRFDNAYDLLKRLKRLDPGEPSLELQFARCERWKSALDGQARTTAERQQRAAN